MITMDMTRMTIIKDMMVMTMVDNGSVDEVDFDGGNDDDDGKDANLYR